MDVGFEVKEASGTGYEVLKQRGAVIVCMSPGNSYFKKDVISALLRTAAHLSEKVVILIPDRPAEYTYTALGNSTIKAARIARLKGNNLKNHSARYINEMVAEGLNANLTIPDWESSIETDAIYHDYKKYIYDLYDKNPAFYHDARQTTKLVIESQLNSEINLEIAVDIAVNYLLQELAFILATPEIYNVQKIAYVYHRKWPIFEDLIAGKYDKPITNIGFIIIS